MSSAKMKLNGDPNVGLYGMATDRYAIISDVSAEKEEISENLGVPVIVQKIARTDLAGIFLAGNSRGLIVPNIIEKRELESLRSSIAEIDDSIKVTVLDTKDTALGNMIICNDSSAIISSILAPQKKKIEDTLGVKVFVTDLMDLSIIGSICLSTNKGFLMNMHAGKEDFEKVESSIGVEGDIGTVNFGGPFVRTGLIANSNGYIAGDQTTGPELTRIDEALGFLDL